MIIDPDAREWLAVIEEQKKELEKLTPLLKLESKRRETLRSPKFHKISDALIEKFENQIKEVEAFVEENTVKFFQAIFGIGHGTPSALYDAKGVVQGALLATEFTARLLTDGTGVFTISGNSLDNDIFPGLPRSDYLLAEESKGQKFVPLI